MSVGGGVDRMFQCVSVGGEGKVIECVTGTGTGLHGLQAMHYLQTTEYTLAHGTATNIMNANNHFDKAPKTQF